MTRGIRTLLLSTGRTGNFTFWSVTGRKRHPPTVRDWPTCNCSLEIQNYYKRKTVKKLWGTQIEKKSKWRATEIAWDTGADAAVLGLSCLCHVGPAVQSSSQVKNHQKFN